MTSARSIALLIALMVGLTACDHSSRHSSHDGNGQAPRPNTTRQVRAAFEAVGIYLTPINIGSGIVPGLRASFSGDGDVTIAIYEVKPPRVQLTLTLPGEALPKAKIARNVLVTYPKNSHLLPNIKRALLMLGRRAANSPKA